MPRHRTSMLARLGSAVVLLAAAGACPAQVVQFQRAIGFTSSDIAYEAAPTADGGSITVGRTALTATIPADIYVVKYDQKGNDQWTRVISSLNQRSEVGYSIRQTGDGGYIIGAETDSVSGQFGIALVKLDAAGSLVWSRVYLGTPFLDSPAGVQLHELGDGSIVVVGRHAFASPSVMAGVLLRVDATGNPIFLNRYSEVGAAIDGASLSFADFVTMSDGFMIAGWMTDAAGAQRQSFLMKTTLAGVPVWARTYLVSGVDTTADSILLAPNHAAFAGRFGVGNAFVAQVDLTGGLVWNRIVGSFVPGFAAALNEADDTMLFAGTALNPTNGALLRLDPLGGFVSGTRYGDAVSISRAHDVISAVCGPGYELAGSTTMAPGNGQDDVHLVRTDENGRTGCRESTFAPGMTFTPPFVAVRTMSMTSDVQHVPWAVAVATPDSGNLRFCFEVGCTADINGDGFVDFADYLEFLNLYDEGCPCVDYTGDGLVDFSDYLEFLNHYDAGC